MLCGRIIRGVIVNRRTHPEDSIYFFVLCAVSFRFLVVLARDSPAA